MSFVDLDQVFVDTLSLPVGGKVYVIQAPDAHFGLWCQRLMEAAYEINEGRDPGPVPAYPLPDGTVLTVENGKVGDANEQALYQRMVGTTWDEMLADKVSWPKMQMVAQTALYWIGVGVEAAEAFWNSGGSPEALAPNRQARRSTTNTVGATTTKPRASTSGTKSPRTATGRSTRKK